MGVFSLAFLVKMDGLYVDDERDLVLSDVFGDVMSLGVEGFRK